MGTHAFFHWNPQMHSLEPILEDLERRIVAFVLPSDSLKSPLKPCFVLVHLINPLGLHCLSTIWGGEQVPNVCLQSKLQEAAKPWTIKEGAVATANEFERAQSYFFCHF